MKRVIIGLVAAGALLCVTSSAMANGPHYRPGFRVNIYGGYPYYPRPYYYGPAYYPPPAYYPAPAYYYPPPVYAPPPVIVPSFSFSFRR
jgi:hypothetical protein